METIPEFRRAFGYVLRNRREMLKITQAELAERIGGSEINIRTLERSASSPAMVTFLLLAEALNIDPKELLGEVLARMAFLKNNDETDQDYGK